MNYYYVLDDQGEPLLTPDVLTWAQWCETATRRVAYEQIGGHKISTVFLGLNHNWGAGEPILWETMVFGGHLDGEQERCSGGRADALRMHARMIQRVQYGR